jgi:hypothetical protein
MAARREPEPSPKLDLEISFNTAKSRNKTFHVLRDSLKRDGDWLTFKDLKEVEWRFNLEHVTWYSVAEPYEGEIGSDAGAETGA